MRAARYGLMSVRFVLLLCAGCATAPGAIVPASLPASARYEESGRAFVAPPGGAARFDEDAEVTFGNAKLTVSAIASARGAAAESYVEDALQHIPGLSGRPLLRDGSVYCMESAPPSRIAACARIDDATRAGGPIVLTTFIADAKTYVSLGGVRVAAEAARSASGFRVDERLPPVK
jgi:hypothetical protein